MYTVEEFIIRTFCLIDDELKAVVGGATLRGRGFAPKLSDAEVLTIEVAGEILGNNSDAEIWAYFRRHWLSLFPALGSRTTFTRQAANLWALKQMLHARLLARLHLERFRLFLVDGFPIPVCAFCRAPQAKCFRGEARIGRCSSKKQWYYGFKGELVVSGSGVIVGWTAGPANADEREMIWEVTEGIRGLLLGDKGYIDRPLSQQLEAERGVRLEPVRLRSNMKETRPEPRLREMVAAREMVETVIGQLTERFEIGRIRARDLWHLTSKLSRKILAHTIAVLMCRETNDNSLRFARLIAA